MLTRTHKILIGLFAVQIVLALVLWLRGDASTAVKEQPVLAGFDAAKITRVQIFAAEKPAVDLVRGGAGRDASWVIASSFNYPADTAKVTALVTPIAKMAAAEPIATSTTRHKQLRVGDTDFERKLVITADGKDTTLYIGAPAGIRRNAVRIGGSDDVYAVSGVSAYSAGGEPRDWAHGAYVEVPRDDVAKLTIQRDDTAIELVRTTPPAAGSGAPPPEPAWTASIGGAPIALAAGESIDANAIDDVVGAAANIEMTAPADPKREGKPVVTFTIERKASGATSAAPIVVDVVADAKGYWVHQRGLDRAVIVDKPRLESLATVDRSKLVKKPPPPQQPPKSPAPKAPIKSK